MESKTEFKDLVVRKRIASLNATAMLAASYEVERHLDMDSLYNGSSADSEDSEEEEKPVTPKKIKEVKAEVVDDVKEVILLPYSPQISFLLICSFSSHVPCPRMSSSSRTRTSP